jgi:hypothetical protein
MKRFEKERCFLCRGTESALHMLLKCLETRNWREPNSWGGTRCLIVNEEVTLVVSSLNTDQLFKEDYVVKFLNISVFGNAVSPGNSLVA